MVSTFVVRPSQFSYMRDSEGLTELGENKIHENYKKDHLQNRQWSQMVSLRRNLANWVSKKNVVSMKRAGNGLN